MGVLAGLAGGGGGAGGGGIPGSGQRISPGTRGFLQTQAISKSRQFVQAGKPARVGQFRGLSANAALRVNEQIALRRAEQPFSRSVSRSQLGAEFATQDIQRASTNRDLLRQRFSNIRGARSGGGRASFLGSGSTPTGARSFPSLLGSF